MKPPLLYEQNALFLSPISVRILARLGLQLRVFTKKAVTCNKFCMGTFLGVLATHCHTLHNTEQNVFFLVGVSQWP